MSSLKRDLVDYAYSGIKPANNFGASDIKEVENKAIKMK